MQNLITPDHVVELAFSGDERAHRELITVCDVAEAEERYLRPVLGDDLYEALRGGEYQELLEEYVAPAIAAWCRYVVEPHLAYRCRECGDASVAHNARLDVTMRHLSRRAQTLTRRLSHYLNMHSSEYEEYSPKLNPLNRCFIYGNIVQVY